MVLLNTLFLSPIIITIKIVLNIHFDFIFLVFSFGRLEDKIINIIIIPPKNISSKIKDNHLLELDKVIAEKLIKEIIININLTFIGFLSVKIINVINNIIAIKIVIIFLSLFKVLTLEVKEFRKYCLFLLV